MQDNLTQKAKLRFVVKSHKDDLGFEECRGCGKKLYRVLAKGSGTVIEIKCPRCKRLNRFP
jgi:hypothetical protein